MQGKALAIFNPYRHHISSIIVNFKDHLFSISQACVHDNIAGEIFAPVCDSSNNQELEHHVIFSMLELTMKWAVKLRNEWWQLVLFHISVVKLVYLADCSNPVILC